MKMREGTCTQVDIITQGRITSDFIFSLCFILFFNLSSLNMFQLAIERNYKIFLTLGKEAKLFEISQLLKVYAPPGACK